MTLSDTRLAGAVNKSPVMAMFPLSGYTHGGQIWSFDYLAKKRYPFLEGWYKIKGLNPIVTRIRNSSCGIKEIGD